MVRASTFFAVICLGLQFVSLAASDTAGVKADPQDAWAALVQKGGLESSKARREVYRELETSRKDQKNTYPENPLSDLKKIDNPLSVLNSYPRLKSPESTPMKDTPVGFWQVTCPAAEGKTGATYFLVPPPQYDDSKSWPLIVVLHGGGSGPGEPWAAHYLALYSNWFGDKPYVVIAVPAPVNKSPWFQKANVEAALDSMTDVCRRFHIDPRRMYLNGHSLGGWGTTDFAWAAPELFAAYAPETCATPLPNPAPNLNGTAFILFNCGSESSVKRLKDAGADAVSITIQSGHSIPHEKTKPLMFDFFDKHANDCAPDLTLTRKLLLEKAK